MVACGLLAIRADASAVMGTGHFMRGLALAEQWRDVGGEVLFITHCDLPALLQRARNEGAQIIKPQAAPASRDEAAEVCKLAKQHSAHWTVLDGYQFDADYQLALKAANSRLLAIDDNGHALRYAADLVLDQNITADERRYRQRAAHTRLLLGTRYALLRREFRSRAKLARKPADKIHNILVTMGGSDPDNVTQKILRAFAENPNEFSVRALVGAGNRHIGALRNIAQNPKTAIQVETNIEDVSELMAWADVAVTAAGCTLWELAYMQVPALMLSLAENQRPEAPACERAGLGIDLGRHESFDSQNLLKQLGRLCENPSLIKKMRAGARELVDGRGAERVVAEMTAAQ